MSCNFRHSTRSCSEGGVTIRCRNAEGHNMKGRLHLNFRVSLLRYCKRESCSPSIRLYISHKPARLTKAPSIDVPSRGRLKEELVCSKPRSLPYKPRHLTPRTSSLYRRKARVCINFPPAYEQQKILKIQSGDDETSLRMLQRHSVVDIRQSTAPIRRDGPNN